MLTIIPLIVIIIALGVILIIAARHMPQVAVLDVSTLPEEREARLKSTILETRLLRKFNRFWRTAAAIFVPTKGLVENWYKKGLKSLRRLERTYHFHVASGLPDTSKKAELKLQEFLDRAQAALAADSLDEAEKSYLAAIKLNPTELVAYEGLGKIYIKRQEWDAGRETFEYIAKNWPQHDQAFALLALIEDVTGHLEKAKNLYLHALSINNEAVEYHLNLAVVYLSLDDKEKALSSLQKAQALEPNNPKVLDQLLQASILVGNKSLAEEVLDKIKKVNPEHGKLGELEEKVKGLL
ncbi:MAG: tetratricopeptide repeat protein [Candidatus Komeilibacteria bacterium]|nr:tetratricopeptide repeat protein [Candidatus Komeilibacteria bacterium]